MIIGVTGLIGYETAAELFRENEEKVGNRFPEFWLRQFKQLGQVDIDKLYKNLYTMKMQKQIEGFWEIGEGGLFGALWKACTDIEKSFEELKQKGDLLKTSPDEQMKDGLLVKTAIEPGIQKICGCEVFIKQIPILQQVVEICELFDVNPYEVPSKGAFLVFAEDNNFETILKDWAGASVLTGESISTGFSNLPDLLQIQAIGKTSETKERVLIMGQDEKTGEIWKRFLTPPARQAKDLENSIRK